MATKEKPQLSRTEGLGVPIGFPPDPKPTPPQSLTLQRLLRSSIPFKPGRKNTATPSFSVTAERKPR